MSFYKIFMMQVNKYDVCLSYTFIIWTIFFNGSNISIKKVNVVDHDGYRGVGRPSSYFHYILLVKFLFYSYFLTPEIPIFLFSENHC